MANGQRPIIDIGGVVAILIGVVFLGGLGYLARTQAKLTDRIGKIEGQLDGFQRLLDSMPHLDRPQNKEASRHTVQVFRVLINEINAHSPDWVELYNPNDEDVDLGRYKVSDDDNIPHMIEPGETIRSRGYYVLDVHKSTTGFAFSQNGEEVVLFGPDGKEIDRVKFPETQDGESYGRDATGNWRVYKPPTRGEKNP